MTTNTVLPQPHNSNYKYVVNSELNDIFFSPSSPLQPDTLCWVLKSKGGTGASELFSRARVINDDEFSSDREANKKRRVYVRYPKGSTYHVHVYNLLPVLENTKGVVLVVPETRDYRKSCMVHFCHDDTFLEVGCDHGHTVHRVNQSLLEFGTPPPMLLDHESNINIASSKEIVRSFGVDKAKLSIEIAKENYPNSHFYLIEDVLTKKGMKEVEKLSQNLFVFRTFPSVLAIDINGNRELPAVLQCLENFMLSDEKEEIRLYIVKSVALYNHLKSVKKA